MYGPGRQHQQQQRQTQRTTLSKHHLQITFNIHLQDSNHQCRLVQVTEPAWTASFEHLQRTSEKRKILPKGLQSNGKSMGFSMGVQKNMERLCSTLQEKNTIIINYTKLLIFKFLKPCHVRLSGERTLDLPQQCLECCTWVDAASRFIVPYQCMSMNKHE